MRSKTYFFIKNNTYYILTFIIIGITLQTLQNTKQVSLLLDPNHKTVYQESIQSETILQLDNNIRYHQFFFYYYISVKSRILFYSTIYSCQVITFEFQQYDVLFLELCIFSPLKSQGIMLYYNSIITSPFLMYHYW